MKDLTIAGVSVALGEAEFGSLKVAELEDGSPIAVPIGIIRGKQEGPCLWIQNGVHGDEYVGAGAIRRLVEEVDTSALRGTIVLIPMLNIQAFRAGSRMAAQDGLDMNRIWPGMPLESAMHLWAHSELVVHTIGQLIREHADFFLDVHDAGRMGLMSPYVSYYQGAAPDFDARVRDAAIATGMDLVWETIPAWVSEKAPGSVKSYLMQEGIPALTLEMGGEGRLRPHEIERMYQAFVNVMKHLNMIDGKPEIPENQIFVNRGYWVRAPIGGLLYIHVEPLQSVQKGDELATITDLFGRIREVLIAPVDGWIVGTRTLGTVATGQYITNVARLVQS